MNTTPYSATALSDTLAKVQSATTTLIDYLKEKQQPQPSLNENSSQFLWEDETPEVAKVRATLMEAASDLAFLAVGPRAYLRSFMATHYDLAAWNTIGEFKVFEKIPANGEISVKDLALQCKLDEGVLVRMLWLLAGSLLVRETKPGYFAHTAISAALVDDPCLAAAMYMQLDEMNKASVEMDVFYRKNPYPQEGVESTYKEKWGTTLYGYYQKYPEKAARFAMAMEGFEKIDHSMINIVEFFDTFAHQTPHRNTVYDIGGGNGHVSLYLAKRFPHLSFVVQDIQEKMFEKTSAGLDPELAKRFRFQQHDFFTPEKPHDTSAAKAYMIRWVLHNWGDDDCVRILSHMVPLLETSREISLLINDTVLPVPGSVPRFVERAMRHTDLAMMTTGSAKQRFLSDWKALLNRVDPRLEIVKVVADPFKGHLGVLEIKILG